MKRALISAILVILVAGLGAADEAADTGPGTTNSEQITQTISLQPGWNSVSFKVKGLTFTEDIKPQCSFNWYNQELAEGASADQISDDDRYHVWTQEAGQWSHPDNLDVSEGYSFNVDSECEFEVSGERERIDSFELEDGWNLVNVPSGLALGQIKDECNLRWYSQELASGTSSDEISEGERKFFWVNDGNSWRDPYEEKDHRGDDGVYINSNGDCRIDSWPYDGENGDSDSEDEDESTNKFVEGDLYFWDTESETDLVNSEAGSDETADFSYNMYDDNVEGQFRWENENEEEYTLWMKNQHTEESALVKKEDEVVNFPVNSQDFEINSNYDLYRLSDDGCTDFRLAVLPADWNREDSDMSSQAYQDSNFTFCPYSNGEDGEKDDKCETGYAWSSWNEECIEINQQIEEGLDQIEDAKWSVETEDNTIHTLDDLSFSSSDESEEIMFHTGYKDGELADHGQTGWCGELYFETTKLESGLATFTIQMQELQNTQYGADQNTQTPYIEVDGETIFEQEDGYISPGEYEQINVELQENENVRIGLEENDLGCGSYSKRTKAIIDIDAGNSPRSVFQEY